MCPIIQRRIERKIESPDWKFIKENDCYKINLDLKTEFDLEKEKFDQYVSDVYAASIISRYPVHKTKGPDVMAKALKFTNHREYEKAARKCLSDDESLRKAIKSKFSDLVTALEGDANPPEQQ